jgi:hypothetical protein
VAFEDARRATVERAVWSQDADANLFPSGEIASATTGAV